jgi:FtsP/CotA-like multicopper oxidase with cupredoxin domain
LPCRRSDVEDAVGLARLERLGRAQSLLQFHRNGVAWNQQVPPLLVAKGERVALVMTNMTGMPHPMHLHGHRFQVVEINGVRLAGAVRDTVRVPPRQRVIAVFDADNPGTWAYHCHMLYHQEAGMFTTIRYV